MTWGEFDCVDLKGIACAVPDNIIENASYYDKYGQEAVDKFINITGVKKRCISIKEQTASDLCFVAANNLINTLKWEKDSIDCILFISQTPDYKLPATSCVLHKRLGLSEKCIAFDVNLGCSGYVYGLYIACSLIKSGNLNRVLLLAGDTISKVVSPEDRSTSMLFGDAGSATALERTKGNKSSKSIKFALKTKGQGFGNIIIPYGGFRNIEGEQSRTLRQEGIIRSDYDLYMNGTEVFNFTINDVPSTINEFIELQGIPKDGIDIFIPHQANLFMLKHIAKKIQISLDKMAVSLDRFGNTSIASIPITIVDTLTNKYNKSTDKLNILLAGFGVGLSWGVVFLELIPEICMPLIFSNEYWEVEGD